MSQEVRRLGDQTAAVSERAREKTSEVTGELSKLKSKLSEATATAFARATAPDEREMDRLRRSMDEADEEARMEAAQDSVRSGKVPVIDVRTASTFVMIGLISLASATFVTMAIAASMH
jgi:hypothetical protein